MANWFYLAFIVTIAMLHVVNNLAVPVSFLGSKSYSLFSGVQDAMTQWWYGHNAVGFFLTAGFLGIMYYFIPKRVERPIYSYRLSIMHFWSLIFLYIWAGPHHLHYTALPDWAQTLGMTFSIMLWMPSWGGMINGLMTLSGAWDRLRTDPVVRLLVVSVAFYGMSTFEGPLMSIKSVNSLSHYTDWTIGHVHSGALGWVGMVSLRRHLLPGAVALEAARALLAAPRRVALLDRDDRHRSLHLVDVGVGHHAGPDVARLRHLGFLKYSFVETVEAMHWPYVIRATGGIAVPPGRRAHGLQRLADDPRRRVDRSRRAAAHRGGARAARRCRGSSGRVRRAIMNHGFFEKNSIVLLIGILVVVSIGGIVEIAPLFLLNSTIEKVQGMRPYSPLELAGRDIYIREGCYNCHSQMIRSLRDEVERYGHYSLAAESMYDHPFQWGSKRTGPDLARVGGKYSDDWHVAHMHDPRSVVPESIMPGYPFLARDAARLSRHRRRTCKTLRAVGVPYTDEMIDEREGRSRARSSIRTPKARRSSSQRYPKAQVRKFDGDPSAHLTELDAVIAYLQMLGTLVDFTKFDAAGPNLR